MSVGLIALLDDIAAIAKVAAASLDDVIGQAGLLVGAASIPIIGFAVAPAWKRLKRLLPS
jgi:uncharacterized protein